MIIKDTSKYTIKLTICVLNNFIYCHILHIYRFFIFFTICFKTVNIQIIRAMVYPCKPSRLTTTFAHIITLPPTLLIFNNIFRLNFADCLLQLSDLIYFLTLLSLMLTYWFLHLHLSNFLIFVIKLRLKLVDCLLRFSNLVIFIT